MSGRGFEPRTSGCLRSAVVESRRNPMSPTLHQAEPPRHRRLKVGALINDAGARGGDSQGRRERVESAEPGEEEGGIGNAEDRDSDAQALADRMKTVKSVLFAETLVTSRLTH